MGKGQFAQEGLLKIDHPDIVKIHSIGTHKNTPYIIMDYIDGIDLEEFIKKRGKLSFDKAMEIFIRILGALSDIYKKGIIHRDIKPKNILIDKDDNPYLTDFGIAKSLYSHIKTSTGGYLGAPAYSSPEQMDGKQVDARSDIYSLGITLYEMLAGKVPYSSVSIEQILKEKFLGKPIPIESFRKDLPENVIYIINKSIVKKPSKRFDTVKKINEKMKLKETIVLNKRGGNNKKDSKRIEQESKKYIIAKKRVRQIKNFYIHLIIYVIVNVFLFIINLVISPRLFWFYWITFFWGIGLFWHTMGVFVFSKFTGIIWKKRKIEEIMKAMDKGKNNK